MKGIIAMTLDNYPAANITAPQPHYGITEDAFPGTLFTTPDNSLRVAVDRDPDGRLSWHVQKRTSATIARSTWTTQFRTRRKAGLELGLGSALVNHPELAAFIATLGHQPTRT